MRDGRGYVRARDFMTSLIVAADHDTSVVEAARLMAAEDIGSLIVTKSDVLAGMVTRREIVGAQLLSDEAYHALVLSDVMTTPVITIGPEADLGQVIALMNQTGERHVPVVEGEAIIGIITATDVIRVLATMKGIADGATLLVSDSDED
ncbi:CBS domain-containing protein [Candidatus Thorarchaeota archaeon]|nr:MAG: CBS domain-containing protein [Candidatus Thorarchaeota archaeon]